MTRGVQNLTRWHPPRPPQQKVPNSRSEWSGTRPAQARILRLTDQPRTFSPPRSDGHQVERGATFWLMRGDGTAASTAGTAKQPVCVWYPSFRPQEPNLKNAYIYSPDNRTPSSLPPSHPSITSNLPPYLHLRDTNPTNSTNHAPAFTACLPQPNPPPHPTPPP